MGFIAVFGISFWLVFEITGYLIGKDSYKSWRVLEEWLKHNDLPAPDFTVRGYTSWRLGGARVSIRNSDKVWYIIKSDGEHMCSYAGCIVARNLRKKITKVLVESRDKHTTNSD